MFHIKNYVVMNSIIKQLGGVFKISVIKVNF